METPRFISSPTSVEGQREIIGIQGKSQEEFFNWKEKIQTLYSHPVAPVTREKFHELGHMPVFQRNKIYYATPNHAVTYDQHGRIVEERPQGLDAKHVESYEYDEDGYEIAAEERIFEPKRSPDDLPKSFRCEFEYEKTDTGKKLTRISYHYLTILPNLEASQLFRDQQTIYTVNFSDPISISGQVL